MTSFQCRESTSSDVRSENGSVTAKDASQEKSTKPLITEEKTNGPQTGILKRNPVASTQKSEIIQNLEKQQVHSGPLLARNVLLHSQSERGRILDR